MLTYLQAVLYHLKLVQLGDCSKALRLDEYCILHDALWILQLKGYRHAPFCRVICKCNQCSAKSGIAHSTYEPDQGWRALI